MLWPQLQETNFSNLKSISEYKSTQESANTYKAVALSAFFRPAVHE